MTWEWIYLVIPFLPLIIITGTIIYVIQLHKNKNKNKENLLSIEHYKGKIIGVLYCKENYDLVEGTIDFSKVEYRLLFEYIDSEGRKQQITSGNEVFSCKEIAEYRTHDYVEFSIWDYTACTTYRPYEEIDGGDLGGNASAIKGLKLIEIPRSWQPKDNFTGELSSQEKLVQDQFEKERKKILNKWNLKSKFHVGNVSFLTGKGECIGLVVVIIFSMLMSGGLLWILLTTDFTKDAYAFFGIMFLIPFGVGIYCFIQLIKTISKLRRKNGVHDFALGFSIGQKNEDKYVVTIFYDGGNNQVKKSIQKVNSYYYRKIARIKKLPIIIYKNKACIDITEL